MRNRSLLFRMIAAFSVVIMVALLAVFTFMSWSTAAEFERFKENVDAQRAADVRFALVRYYVSSGDWTGIQPYVKHIADMWEWHIIVTDANGIVVADSSEELLGTWYSEEKAGMLVSSFGEGQSFGTLYVEPQTPPGTERALLAVTLQRIGHFLLLGLLVANAVAVVLAWFLTRRILAPVEDLRVAVQRLGAGDLSQRVEVVDVGELSELGAAFNTMATDLQRANKVQRQMIADIAHELRTPLSNIRGYIEAVRDKVIAPDEETVATLDAEALLLSRLVDDLQDISIVEAGQMTLDIQPEDLSQLLAQTVDATTAAASARRIQLELHIADAIPLVAIDYHRICQVLRNLLENAIAHTGDGGRVTVEATGRGDYVEVSVSDTGEGIEQTDLPHIFNRFYRADRSRTRATGGRGLGLTISKGLIEAHRGMIGVTSAAGEGSRFYFTIPIYRDSSQEPMRED